MIPAATRAAGWSSGAVERIAALVRDRAGLVFSHPRYNAIETTIRQEAKRAGRPDPDAYLRLLETDGTAVDALAAQLTIGETYFFRDAPQFELIRREILPALRPATGGRRLRMWSAGCASGEEPYSLAILARELGMSTCCDILGTDLARDRLEAARAARYGRWSLRGVPQPIIDAYFTRRDTRFDLIAPVRDMVEFRYQNLAELDLSVIAPGSMDLVLCRNVLIYFDAATVTRVARQLLDTLTQDGWLLLGATDPPMTEYSECEVIVTTAGLAYRRKGMRPRRASQGRMTAWLEAAPPPAPPVVPVTPATPPPAGVDDFRIQPTPANPLQELFARMVEALARGEERDAAGLAGTFIERGGDELTAWTVRVRALANAGDLAAAGQSCAAALERHPLSAELSYLHALLLAQAGRHADAADAARRAVYLDHSLAVAHVMLGDMLVRLERQDDAARAFRAAQRLLAQQSPEAIAPASGGERSGRLAAAVTARLALLERGR